MSKSNLALAFLILLKFVLQYFAINEVYELHRDEFLHLDLGKHLASGYLTVPPVTGFLSFLINQLGNHVFWVKFFPALFGVLTMVTVWKTTEVLGGGLYARILACICIIFSVLLRINTLYQPNSLEYLCWTFLLYTLVRFTLNQDHKWLWGAALAFAVGFLNKYNIVFLLLGLVPALLVTSSRSIFRHRKLYMAALVALVIISPNLIWQMQNEFPVVHHLQELSEKQLVNVDRVDFLLSQLLFFTGSLWLLALAFFSFFRYGPHKKFTFIFWCYVFTMTLYFLLKAKGYYAIGLYPVLMAFGATYLEHLLRKGWQWYLRPLFMITPVVLFIPMYNLALPVLSPDAIIQRKDQFQRLGLLKWEDGRDHLIPQDFADMLGWQELAAIVDSTFELIPDKDQTLIHCDNYGQAGGINFYSKQHDIHALTLHADYMNWYPLDEMKINHVILIKSAPDEDPERVREKQLFEKVILTGAIKNRFAREHGTKVYLLLEAKKNINDILATEIKNIRLK